MSNPVLALFLQFEVNKRSCSKSYQSDNEKEKFVNVCNTYICMYIYIYIYIEITSY